MNLCPVLVAFKKLNSSGISVVVLAEWEITPVSITPAGNVAIFSTVSLGGLNRQILASIQ
jgi:hypothetical protein